MRWSFVPPLLVYFAGGCAGITGIAGTFYLKNHLGMSAETVAALGFWATLPWTLKMPLGHLVDLGWRYRGALLVTGAALIALGLLVMVGLLHDRVAMQAWLSVQAWYALSVLSLSLGYVLQDVVADAMTVAAVPRANRHGRPLDERELHWLHTTMQALGRSALILGTLVVGVVNLVFFTGADQLPPQRWLDIYLRLHLLALLIPAMSVSGLALEALLRHRTPVIASPPPADWSLLGGGMAFAVLAATLGLSRTPAAEALVFAASLVIVTLLMRQLLGALEPQVRRTLMGTALVVFMFRAAPDPGPGPSWWIIDRLGVGPAFHSRLGVLGSMMALAGLLLLRRWMARHSLAHTVVALALVWTLLSLPTIGMYYGLHDWLSAHTRGMVDGRWIVVADTTLLGLFSEVAMVPMLAWIARTAPERLKATYFAVMVSFANLGLLLSRLLSQGLNEIFVVTREVRDPASGAVTVAANYAQLGALHITATALTLALPLATVTLLRFTRLRAD